MHDKGLFSFLITERFKHKSYIKSLPKLHKQTLPRAGKMSEELKK